MVLTQSAWPASTTSSFFSMSALNFTLTMSGNCSIMTVLTAWPSGVVFSFFWSFST